MNRQSKLEEEFPLFVDGARVEACDRLQYLYGSKEEVDVQVYYPRVACLIFEVSHGFKKGKQHPSERKTKFPSLTT